MSFNAPKLMLVGLAAFVLPTRTIRLCDGGFCTFNGNLFTSLDDLFGGIESVEVFATGVGDEAPAGRLVFLPQSTAAAADLSQPSFQDSPFTFWTGRVDEATGVVVHSRVEFTGLLDVTRLIIGRGVRKLEMDFVSENERLFQRNKGNNLSPRFHKLINPGELGLDNANGLQIAVPWGVETPPRGYTNVGSGGGGGAFFGEGRNAFN